MKTVDEIMGLVYAYRRSWVQSDDTNVIKASHENLRSAIEAALKEREAPPKAQPMATPCKGIEIEPGVFSGCDQSGGDCPTCGE